MSTADENTSLPPSRRQFLQRSAVGAWLVGAGSALGLLPEKLPAAQSKLGARTLGKEFTYDLGELRHVDPKLVLYEETGIIQGGFKETRAVTVDHQDKVYVVGDRFIRVFGPDGTRMQEMALTELPRCVAVAADGTIYVGMKDHVERYSPQGALQAKWQRPSSRSVFTALVVAENDVFVADAGQRLVLHYDLKGKPVAQIGKKDPARNIPGFVVPSPYFDLALGAGDILWVANPGRHRLEAYTFKGDLETSWGMTSSSIAGFCGCCNPVHFALLPDGRFVTSEKGLTRVKIYSVKGEFEGVVAGPDRFPRQENNPHLTTAGIDIAVDSQGRVLLADPLNSDVRIFSRKKNA